MFFTLALRFSTFLKLLQRAFRSGSIAFSEISLVRIQCNMKSCKNVQSKTKNKSNTSSYYGKNQILSLQENSLVILQTINFQFRINITINYHVFKQTRDYNGGMKTIQEDLGTLTYISAYSGIFRHYSGILRTLVYSK